MRTADRVVLDCKCAVPASRRKRVEKNGYGTRRVYRQGRATVGGQSEFTADGNAIEYQRQIALIGNRDILTGCSSNFLRAEKQTRWRHGDRWRHAEARERNGVRASRGAVINSYGTIPRLSGCRRKLNRDRARAIAWQ